MEEEQQPEPSPDKEKSSGLKHLVSNFKEKRDSLKQKLSAGKTLLIGLIVAAIVVAAVSVPTFNRHLKGTYSISVLTKFIENGTYKIVDQDKKIWPVDEDSYNYVDKGNTYEIEKYEYYYHIIQEKKSMKDILKVED